MRPAKPKNPVDKPTSENPLGVVRADDLNMLAEEVRRLGRTEGEGLVVDHSSTGVQISIPPRKSWIWAKLTGEGDPGRYSWEEVKPIEGGDFETVVGGRSGTTTLGSAFEANDTAGIAANTIVRLEQGHGQVTDPGNELDQEWNFSVASAGGMSISGNFDGIQQDCFSACTDFEELTTSGYSGITDLEFDECHFQLSKPGAAKVIVQLGGSEGNVVVIGADCCCVQLCFGAGGVFLGTCLVDECPTTACAGDPDCGA